MQIAETSLAVSHSVFTIPHSTFHESNQAVIPRLYLGAVEQRKVSGGRTGASISGMLGSYIGAVEVNATT